MMFCTQCGWNNDRGGRFCYKCGNPLASPVAEAGAVAANAPQGAPQPPMPEITAAALPMPETTAAALPMPESTPVAPRRREKTHDRKRASPEWKFLVIGIGATAIALVAAFTILNVLGVIQFAPKQETFEGAGYSTPEEAASAYIEAVKSMDVRRVWSTFAIESYVENFDFVSYLERFQAYTPNMQQLAPPSNEFSYSANILIRLYDASPPYSALWVLETIDGGGFVTFPDGYTEGNGTIPDGLSYRQFSRNLEDRTYETLQQIQSMEITDIALPDSFSRYARKYGLEDIFMRYSSETNTSILEKNRRFLGADEIVDVIIFLRINNDEYVTMPSLVRYGDRWRVLSRSSNAGMLLGFSADHFLISIDG